MSQPQMFSSTMQAFLDNNAKLDPPSLPCTYKIGDRVLFFNAAGIVFGPYTVLGYTTAENIVSGGFIYIDYDCYWFPVAPAHLVPYIEGDMSGAEFATKYAMEGLNYENHAGRESMVRACLKALQGFWGSDEHVVFWARSYGGSHEELYKMTCEYLNTRPVNIPPCNADLIRRVLSIGPGSAT